MSVTWDIAVSVELERQDLDCGVELEIVGVEVEFYSSY